MVLVPYMVPVGGNFEVVSYMVLVYHIWYPYEVWIVLVPYSLCMVPLGLKGMVEVPYMVRSDPLYYVFVLCENVFQVIMCVFF